MIGDFSNWRYRGYTMAQLDAMIDFAKQQMFEPGKRQTIRPRQELTEAEMKERIRSAKSGSTQVWSREFQALKESADTSTDASSADSSLTIELATQRANEELARYAHPVQVAVRLHRQENGSLSTEPPASIDVQRIEMKDKQYRVSLSPNTLRNADGTPYSAGHDGTAREKLEEVLGILEEEIAFPSKKTGEQLEHACNLIREAIQLM